MEQTRSPHEPNLLKQKEPEKNIFKFQYLPFLWGFHLCFLLGAFRILFVSNKYTQLQTLSALSHALTVPWSHWSCLKTQGDYTQQPDFSSYTVPKLALYQPHLKDSTIPQLLTSTHVHSWGAIYPQDLITFPRFASTVVFQNKQLHQLFPTAPEKSNTVRELRIWTNLRCWKVFRRRLEAFLDTFHCCRVREFNSKIPRKGNCVKSPPFSGVKVHVDGHL